MPASSYRMTALVKVVPWARNWGVSRSVPHILTVASRCGGRSAPRSPNSSLQTGRAQPTRTRFSSPDTSCAVRANKAHPPELASMRCFTQETRHLSSRSFCQSALPDQGIQTPKDGDEEGGLSMQGTLFLEVQVYHASVVLPQNACLCNQPNFARMLS